MNATATLPSRLRIHHSVERASPAPRMRALAVVLLAVCLPAVVQGPSRANPVPEGLVLTHIHDVQGDLCATPPIGSCADVVQVTDRTGILAFDFILLDFTDNFMYLYATSDVQFTVQWSHDWQYVAAEVCGSGVISVVHDGTHATFSIEDPHGVPVNGNFATLGRLVLNVTSEGQTWFTQMENELYAEWIEGRAGVVCGNCMTTYCDSYGDLYPILSPRSLELSADSLGVAAGTFHVDTGGIGGEFDGYTFSASEPWITLAAISLGQPHWPEYDVMVHAHAAGLALGTHEAWIEVHTPYCLECEHVFFTVSDTIDTATGTTTWGSVKNQFR